MKLKKQQDVCEVRSVDELKVRAVKEAMPPEEDIYSLSEVFGVMADSSRLKIIYALSKEELCVCDIASILGISISAVSHQLRILRNMRLVKFRKEAKRVYYSLDDKHIKRLFAQGLEHVKEG